MVHLHPVHGGPRHAVVESLDRVLDKRRPPSFLDQSHSGDAVVERPRQDDGHGAWADGSRGAPEERIHRGPVAVLRAGRG